ncbi:uncharacterized protein LOC135102838 [Scylla paramamosain]|uniref:uncharacterized protein LOC135102838 n=1 Tax=Scylla paramamosain TaxID=85552 RepID=UPI003083474B
MRSGCDRAVGAVGCSPVISEAAAAAALARANEAEEKKREARAKDERRRKAAKRAEEEEIETMKKAAAAASETLERKQAVKSEQAKTAARLAAKERAAAFRENYLNTSSVPSYNVVEGREVVNATGSKNIEKRSVADSFFGRQTETEMENEMARQREARARAQKAREAARKAEDEKLETKKRAAAEAGEALERSDEIKSAEARKAARLAAEMRAARTSQTSQNCSINLSSGPSQPKITKREAVSATGEQDSNSHGVNKVNETHENFKPNSISISDEKETVDVIDIKHTLMKDIEREIVDVKHTLMESSERKVSHDKQNRTTMHGSNKEENLAHPAEQESRQRVTKDHMEDHVHHRGVRPKEKTLEYHSQSAQSNAQQNTPVTTEIKQSSKYSSEKEIVSVTRDEQNPSNQSFSVRSEAQMSHYMEVNTSPRMDKTQVKESKQEHSQGFQSGHYAGDGRVTSGIDSNRHRGKFGHQTLDHHALSAKGNRSFESSHLQQHSSHHHHHCQNSHPNGKRQQPPHNNHHKVQQQEQQRAPARASSRRLICGSCQEKYNFKEKMPRELYCRHSICTSCIRERINPDFSVACPHCPVQTWNIKKAHWCPVNEFLIQKLGEIQKDDYMDEIDENMAYSSAPCDKRQSHSQPGNGNTERSGNKQSLSKPKKGEYNAPARSPHGSKCIAMGVHPTHYCSACIVWLCAKCAEAEHMIGKCSLKPLKDQLTEMKQNYNLNAKRTQELLKKSIQSLENDCNEEKIFQLWMRAAFENMEKKQENIKQSLQVGRKLLNTLSDVMQTEPSTENLIEALTSFQIMEDIASEVHQWWSDECSAMGVDMERTACLKCLMKRTLSSLPIRNGTSDMYAADQIPDTKLFSELRAEGGRFHLHALRKDRPTRPEARALPLQCFKSCQDATSRLVFLDLSWGGQCHGRLYIRLTGDTLRGRQFVSLCTGEEGGSFEGLASIGCGGRACQGSMSGLEIMRTVMGVEAGYILHPTWRHRFQQRGRSLFLQVWWQADMRRRS